MCIYVDLAYNKLLIIGIIVVYLTIMHSSEVSRSMRHLGSLSDISSLDHTPIHYSLYNTPL